MMLVVGQDAGALALRAGVIALAGFDTETAGQRRFSDANYLDSFCSREELIERARSILMVRKPYYG